MAERFIAERLRNNESTIFVADEGERLCGFVQLYPSFCSVDAIKIFILYDLYVDAADRKKGVGALLMQKAAEFSKNEGAS